LPKEEQELEEKKNLHEQHNVSIPKELTSCPECGIAIFVQNYETHLGICPTVQRRRKTQKLECFQKNINGNVPKQLKSLKELKDSFESQEEFMAFVRKINATFEEALKKSQASWNIQRPYENDKVKSTTVTTSDDQSNFPVQIESPACLSEETSNEEQVSKNKHMFQQASIVGLVMKKNCLDDKVTLVDMGAGRAELSFTFAQTLRLNHLFAVPDKSDSNPLEVRHILVDRNTFRRRKDNQMRLEHPLIAKNNLQSHQDSVVRRITIDIQDLHIGRVKELASHDAVCISKHLCGVATDLSLRCLENTNVNDNNQKHMNVRGYFICLCCHHVCHWDEYINQDFWMKELKLTPHEFTLAKTMSSWGVTCFREDVQSNNVFGALSIDEKLEFGWKCKRLIDFGRIDYLRKRNYDAYLVQYIQKSISPECLMMIALPRVTGDEDKVGDQ